MPCQDEWLPTGYPAYRIRPIDSPHILLRILPFQYACFTTRFYFLLQSIDFQVNSLFAMLR